MHPSLFFLSRFFRHPRSIASIVPTSRYALRRVCEKIREGASVIVEYGPGTGDLARHILASGKLAPHGKLILIEQNPEFASHLLSTFSDPRVRVFCSGADRVREILGECGEETADHVLSSIPLSLITPAERRRILSSTASILRIHGSFIVFLYRRRVLLWLKEFFPVVTIDRELWNLPPIAIFEARKK